MSCNNASAPLNLIENVSVLQKCSVVCDYKGNYPEILRIKGYTIYYLGVVRGTFHD